MTHSIKHRQHRITRRVVRLLVTRWMADILKHARTSGAFSYEAATNKETVMSFAYRRLPPDEITGIGVDVNWAWAAELLNRITSNVRYVQHSKRSSDRDGDRNQYVPAHYEVDRGGYAY